MPKLPPPDDLFAPSITPINSNGLKKFENVSKIPPNNDLNDSTTNLPALTNAFLKYSAALSQSPANALAIAFPSPPNKLITAAIAFANVEIIVDAIFTTAFNPTANAPKITPPICENAGPSLETDVPRLSNDELIAVIAPCKLPPRVLARL